MESNIKCEKYVASGADEKSCLMQVVLWFKKLLFASVPFMSDMLPAFRQISDRGTCRPL